MPNSQGIYTGDQATVLPDNTNAMLHFGDQFVQMEQQRKIREEYDKRQEQDRVGRLQKGINERIYNNDYLNNDATNPMVKAKMVEIANKAMADDKQYGPSASYDTVNKGAMDLAEGSRRIDQTNQNMINSVAQYRLKHPNFDPENLAIHNIANSAWFKKDEKGNSVAKTLAEINPNENYLANELKQNGDYYYNDGAAEKESDAYVKGKHMQDISSGASYKDGGALDVPGFKGHNIPISLITPTLTDGKYIPVLKSENYRLPNATSDYFYDGKPIKVLPKEIFDDYYTQNEAVKAKVNRQVKAALATPVKDANGEEVQYGPDSEYAKMLTQKFAYDALQGHVNNNFALETIDESDKMKRQAKKDSNEEERLLLSEHNSQRQDEKINLLAKKDNSVETQDIFSEIKLQSDSANPANQGKALTTLSATAQGALIDLAKKITGKNDINQADLILKTNKAGEVELRRKEDNTIITTVDYKDVNAGKVNPSAPQKQSVLQKAKEVTNNVINKITGIKPEQPKGTAKFDIINPKTGEVVMPGVDEETAKKAESKGYKRK